VKEPSSTAMKKKTKKERLEEAYAKAKKEMEADKKKVQETIKNRLAEGKTVTANIKSVASTPKPKSGTTEANGSHSVSVKTTPSTTTTTRTPVTTTQKPSAATVPLVETPSAAPPPVPPVVLPDGTKTSSYSAPGIVPSGAPPDLAVLQFQMFQQAMAQAGVYNNTPFHPHQVQNGGLSDPSYRAISPVFVPLADLTPRPNVGSNLSETKVIPSVPNTETKIVPPVSSKPKTPMTTSMKTKPASRAELEDTDEDDEDDEDDDGDMVPLPPHLQQQVSMQVLENFQANLLNLPSPHTQPPPVDMHALQQAGITQAEIDAFDPNYVDSDPINMDQPPSRQGPSFSLWLCGVIAVAAILSGLLAEDKSVASTNSSISSSSLQQICFSDTEHRYHVNFQEIPDPSGTMQTVKRRVLIDPCKDADNTASCPHLGYCSDGVLVRCTHDDFVVDETKVKCKVKPEILVLVDEWTAVLESMYIQNLCADPDSPLPLVDYDRLKEETSLPLLDKEVIGTNFNQEYDEEGRLRLGLLGSTSVVIPLSCRLQHRLKILFQEAYLWALSFIKALMVGFFKYAWLIMKTYPRESSIASIIVGAYYWYTTVKATKRKIIIDTAKMRDMALDKLREASDETHYVMALRDDVIADLTPYDLNDKMRKYYRTQIWPRVMGQFMGDNRLKQSQHMDATKKQVKLYYQWVASKSAKKKAVRINVNRENGDEQQQS